MAESGIRTGSDRRYSSTKVVVNTWIGSPVLSNTQCPLLRCIWVPNLVNRSRLSKGFKHSRMAIKEWGTQPIPKTIVLW